MSSSTSPFGSSMDQAAMAMGAILSEQSRLELFGGILTFFWLMGGLFDDENLYLVSMTGSLLIFVYSILKSFKPGQRTMAIIHTSSFRKLFVAITANYFYTTGRSQGDSDIIIFSNTIPVNDISDLAVLALFIVWIITKYGDNIDQHGIDIMKTPILLIRGTLRGTMIVAAFYAIFTPYVIKGQIALILFVFYLIEPFVYYVYSLYNQSYSTTDMVIGDSRLPTVALRESFLSNLLMLWLTMAFKGVSGSEWGFLRTYYFIGFIFVLFLSFDAIKEFNNNPLGKGILGEFLNNSVKTMEDINLADKLGYVIEEDSVIDAGNKLKYELSPGSILVPLEENKGQTTAMIIGKSESIIDTGKEKIGEMNDGIATVLIPTKNLQKLRKSLTLKDLGTIDFEKMNLPSIQEIQSLISKLSYDMQGWIGNIKNELSKFDLSNYGITEKDGVTTINLPGISIVDGKNMTSVKVGGIRIIDTQQATTVRIGSFLTVIDLPKMNLVSLPGINVLDIAGKGSAVDLFGFKISDGVPAEKISEVKTMLLAYMDKVENSIDSQIGRILADQKSSVGLSMSWNGEFKPLLKSGKSSFGDHLALGEARHLSRSLLTSTTATVPQLTSAETQFIELTGISAKGGKARKQKKGKTRKLKSPMSYEIQLGKGKVYTNRPQETKETIDDKLNKVSKKLAEVQKKIDSKDKDTNEITDEFDNIIDVGYEIVDDDSSKYEITDIDEDEQQNDE